MSQTIGEKLRQAREARDITVGEVAEQTRISPLYIESIENDDYRTLPGGIFNKGFVKSFAKFVGVDEQEAMQDYSSLISQQQISQPEEAKTSRPQVLTDERASSSTIFTIVVAVVILGLMSWGILAFVRYVQKNSADDAVANSENSNKAANVNAASAAAGATPTPINAPSMNDLKVEFKTSGEPISLASTSDGKRTNTLITPDNSAVFEPKDSLNLVFAKSLVQNAQLTINGKPIKMPSAPRTPNRIVIEFEINKNNIEQIWQNGEITFGDATTNANISTR